MPLPLPRLEIPAPLPLPGVAFGVVSLPANDDDGLDNIVLGSPAVDGGADGDTESGIGEGEGKGKEDPVRLLKPPRKIAFPSVSTKTSSVPFPSSSLADPLPSSSSSSVASES